MLNTMEQSTKNEVDVVITVPEKDERKSNALLTILINVVVLSYFAYATFHYITISEFTFYSIIIIIIISLTQPSDFHHSGDTCVEDCQLTLCSPYGMLLFVCGATYLGIIYFKLLKSCVGKTIERLCLIIEKIFSSL
jgi:hypothetical protein